MQKRFTEEQIVSILREAEAGDRSIGEVYRPHSVKRPHHSVNRQHVILCNSADSSTDMMSVIRFKEQRKRCGDNENQSGRRTLANMLSIVG